MKDIKIFKKCQKCDHWLTLMESVRSANGKMYIGIRCLNCGYSGFTELWEVVYKAELLKNDKDPFSEICNKRDCNSKIYRKGYCRGHFGVEVAKFVTKSV